uniref:Uncharacterized protein n=1 Tax=Rhizophora mucronata TaxID=61149 RepID=A0A2P2MPK9_RHIMU
MLETKNYESGRVRLIGQISTQRTLLLQNKLRQSLHLSKVDQKERWFRTPTTNKMLKRGDLMWSFTCCRLSKPIFSLHVLGQAASCR